jgi:hypothetical protein
MREKFDQNDYHRAVVAGFPAVIVSIKLDSSMMATGKGAFILANSRIFLVSMFSKDTDPEDDAELQKILNSFRALGRTVEAPQIRSTKEGTVYTYKSARCAITIPDGWAEIQTPSQQSPGSALMARNAQGTHYLHLIIMKAPPGESGEMDDEGIAQMKRGMRDGNYGEYLTELTDTTITVSGSSAIVISGTYSGGLVSNSETVWMQSNGYIYGITFYSKDVRPEDDTELQAILNSFRLL